MSVDAISGRAGLDRPVEPELGPFLSPASLWVPEQVGPSPWLEHAPFAFWLVKVARPRTVVECAPALSYAYLVFCQAVQRLGADTACYAVETGGADARGGCESAALEKYHDKRYGRFSQICSSGSAASPESFQDGSIDLIHMDATHDVEAWLPKLSERGLALVRRTGWPRSACDGSSVWTKLCDTYPSFAFEFGEGLGLFGVGPRIPDQARILLFSPAHIRRGIRAIYGRLGAGVADRCRAAQAEDELRTLRNVNRLREVATRRAEAEALRADKAESELTVALAELSRFKQLLHASENRADALLIENRKLIEAGGRRLARVPDPSGNGRSVQPSASDGPSEARSTTPTFLASLPDIEDDKGQPLNLTVSVVIPTFNAGPEFHWLLRNLRAQRNLQGVEVVIVDSGSNDGTVSLAREMDCKVVEVEPDHSSGSFCRNLGADVATGSLLLFMAQDAFPIGDYWLYGLAAGLIRPLPDGGQLTAVSCAEFPRSDSQIFDDFLIHSHYAFLGCSEADRVGQLNDGGHDALRIQGQLSDVTCLIRREAFQKYRYHGPYAEDLLLGIRLIRDGHRLAMLSSIKAIHSHTRPLGYYVRRGFADVTGLVKIFPNHPTPRVNSAMAAIAAAFSLADSLSPLRPTFRQTPAEALDAVIERARVLEWPEKVPSLAGRGDFGIPALAAWIDRSLAGAGRVEGSLSPEEADDCALVRNTFVDRLAHLRSYVAPIYPVLDETVAAGLNAAIQKTLGMALGASLAFFGNWSARSADEDDAIVAELEQMLLSGI